MSQQRMAASADFQERVKQARSKDAGNSHKSGGGGDNAPKLIGGGSYDKEVQRAEQAHTNDALTGSQNAQNISAYANVSKSATASNGNFSADQANKWANTARAQSNTNKQQEAESNFSGQRVQNNTNFASDNRERNNEYNKGFSMNTTNSFINNASQHRAANTQESTQFADKTTDKYLNKNKQWQVVDLAALDKQIRSAPMQDEAKAQIYSNNTFGDMYSYGRNNLPKWNAAPDSKPVERPDFESMYDKTTSDINNIKIKGV